jgi:integrase
MQSPPKPILKYAKKLSVRVLRPKEYVAISEVGNKVHMDALLYTGMRYIEAQRFHENPDWLDASRGNVHLPPQAILKAKRKQLDRWVRLNQPGTLAVQAFLQGKQLPIYESWGEDLKRWAGRAGVEAQGLGPKTLRKTWESWLVCSFPDRMPWIVLNQGHTAQTSIAHYLNMPFDRDEIAEMKVFVDGMF